MKHFKTIAVVIYIFSLFGCINPANSKPITYSVSCLQIPNRQLNIGDDVSKYLTVTINANNVDKATFNWYCKPFNSDKEILVNTNTYSTVLKDLSDSLDSVFYENGMYYCEIVLANLSYCEKIITNKVPVQMEFCDPNIPVISINTSHNQDINSKEYYLDADFSLIDTANSKLFLDDIKIKARGNTTFTKAKKGFTLKLEEKTSLLGMPKHKRWNLIANYMDNSFLRNEAAFYISRKLNMDYTVRGQFVNLVINGKYHGLYYLCEAIKVNKDRVNIDDEDFLLEMDDYFDEPLKFRSAIKNMPVQLKEDEKTESDLDFIESKINYIESILYSPDFPYTDSNYTVYDSSFTKYIDIDSFAKFYLVNEIMNNFEVGGPKSCYFTYDTSESLLKAGPVWDFDWGGAKGGESLVIADSLYYDALFKTKEFNEKLKELLSSNALNTTYFANYIENQYNLIKKSVELDEKRWGKANRNPVKPTQPNFRAYVEELIEAVTFRLEYLKNTFK